ncbi:MAG: ABC transporter ATP-binding protein [Paraclostridium sp.]
MGLSSVKSNNVVEIKDLVKKYKDNVAVDNVTLNIAKGDIYGLLGPNGAGKSTIINIISGVLNPTYGDIKIFNNSTKNREVKKQIGLIPQNLAIYSEYTAYENIKFFGKLYGLRGDDLENSIKEVLIFTGLKKVKDDSAKTFSGGMMRRLNIACGIVHKPKLIIMDEPTVGIDAQSRNHILDSIKKLNEEGATIIYTSHYMEEVEDLCTKIGIIDHGQIIAEGTKEELKNIVSDSTILNIEIEDIESININEIKNIVGVIDISINENMIKINSVKEVNNLDKIINYMINKNIKIKNIGYKDIDLESVFLSLTGRNLRD